MLDRLGLYAKDGSKSITFRYKKQVGLVSDHVYDAPNKSLSTRTVEETLWEPRKAGIQSTSAALPPHSAERLCLFAVVLILLRLRLISGGAPPVGL